MTIDYSTELLYELLRVSDSGDARGPLFGMRNGKSVWILAAHRLAGAAPVGIFVARGRGEVFLTESDLAFLDAQRADLALAVAGGKGGFFVRERDGSIQTIQSYEEFWLPCAQATTSGAARTLLQGACPAISSIKNWLRQGWLIMPHPTRLWAAGRPQRAG